MQSKITSASQISTTVGRKHELIHLSSLIKSHTIIEDAIDILSWASRNARGLTSPPGKATPDLPRFFDTYHRFWSTKMELSGVI